MTISLPEAAKGTKTRVHLPTGKDVEVKIPAGLTERPAIRLKGQGWPSANGKAGDALITVHVAPHPLFKPDGADLRLDLPITLYEAALGGKVRVPTLDGAVELAIPAGTNSGRTFRLKGKGLKSKSGAGDLLATVRIMLPEQQRRRVQGTDAEMARRQALRSAQGFGVTPMLRSSRVSGDERVCDRRLTTSLRRSCPPARRPTWRPSRAGRGRPARSPHRRPCRPPNRTRRSGWPSLKRSAVSGDAALAQ